MMFPKLALIVWLALGLSACQDKPPVAPAFSNGAKIYAAHCAACHGDKLQGQALWRQRLPNGKMPAPPHDESGHTWHHPDAVLFGITKYGLVSPYAPAGYASDMPGFWDKLSDDEIRSVLGFIASHWTSEDVRAARAEMIRNMK